MDFRMPFLRSVLLLLLCALFIPFGCGGDDDDDDDSAASQDDDDAGDDDDSTDDDASDDDDATDDDAADDDSVDEKPFVPVYDPVLCLLPDPEGLGAGITVGGGPIAGDVTVYVFSDADCSPIEGALVNGTATDSDGKAVVAPTKSSGTIAVTAEGYWSWVIKADASVMYFRLRGESGAYADSDEGQFQFNGNDLDLSNPVKDYTLVNFTQLLNATIHLGAVLPGINRAGIFSADFDHLMAEEEFDLSYDYDEDPTETVALPKNIYWPEMDVTIDLVGLLYAGAYAANESYKTPVSAMRDEHPIEGLVAGITLGNALTADTVLELVGGLIGGADLMEVVTTILEPVINDALEINYFGVLPDWDGTGAPDIDLVAPGKESVSVQVENADEGHDYLTVLAGEVGNRALWPMGLKIASSGVAEMAAAATPDSDYILAVGKTNALQILTGETTDAVELSFALRYADELSDWEGSVSVDSDSDFPTFSADTMYSDFNGELTWSMADGAEADVFLLVVNPTHDEIFDMGIAVLPGTETGFNVNAFGEGATGYEDVLFLLGIDLPDSVDINEFDPQSMLYHNSRAVAFWTNVPVYLWFDFL